LAPITQDHIDTATPLGANLVAGGATFRAWAPQAREVHLKLNTPSAGFRKGPGTLLKQDSASGLWSGFVAGVRDGDTYLFYVVGAAGEGFKRDPFARDLGFDPDWPDCDCVVRDPGAFPWHDGGFRRPDFNDLVVYQFHVGTYYAVNPDGSDRRTKPGGTFLDALGRLGHWLELGVNAVEPLPVVEFETMTSEGYNSGDLFSPETRYALRGDDLQRHLDKVNGLLADRGHAPLTRAQLDSPSAQLKAFIDVCHVYGLAVLLDVVYNHAGGGFPGGRQGFDPRSLYFFDSQDPASDDNSLYFKSGPCPPGGLFFGEGVRRLLLANAQMFLDEYHADGFRFDEASFIDEQGGFPFLQKLTDTLRKSHPDRVLIAEYWRHDQVYAVRPPARQGAGFDAVGPTACATRPAGPSSGRRPPSAATWT
jgi:1,4-alpha-glucan branching enzyme